MARCDSDTMQAAYLNDLRKQRLTVTVYLTTRLMQTGVIESFDQHAVLLRQGGTMNPICKHIIAGVMPATKAQRTLSSAPARGAVRSPEQDAVPVIVRKVTRRTIYRS